MSDQVFPTRGNLISTKKSLDLSKLGYDLLDRKRNILVREMMLMIDKANIVKNEVDVAYQKAYKALQRANITSGIIEHECHTVELDDGLHVSYRSVMGVELPKVSLEEKNMYPYYGLYGTESTLDYAYVCFNDVKRLTVVLAEVENSVYRLAQAIKKTQRRANSLKNIVIPKFTETSKYISSYLEEKEREDFSRLKVIKATKQKKSDEN